METENYAIYQTWDYMVESYQYLTAHEMFYWAIGTTALVCFILGRLSK